MYISYEETEDAAEAFLEEHHPSRTIPVPIEEIVEIKLGISVVPIMGLLSRVGIDAFLSHDFTELFIDHEQYMGQANRSRFTLAHEVGHYVLHQDIVAKITTMDEWKKFILGEGTRRAVYEIYADNFAGCLLMPKKEVTDEYNRLREGVTKQFEKAGLEITDEKTIISYIANQVGKIFDTSQKAAEVRLSKLFIQKNS